MSINSRITKKALSEIESVIGKKLTLGSLLLSIRQADEMTQVAFSELLDISKQQLCDIEHNRKCVSPKLAAIYAEKLGYSKEQFIRLSLQDLIDRDQLDVVVDISPKIHKNNVTKSRASGG